MRTRRRRGHQRWTLLSERCGSASISKPATVLRSLLAAGYGGCQETGTIRAVLYCHGHQLFVRILRRQILKRDFGVCANANEASSACHAQTKGVGLKEVDATVDQEPRKANG